MMDAFRQWRIVLICLQAVAATSSFGQPLFSYGDESVSKAEFLKAYHKNNATAKPTEKSYRDYLDLYLR
jgi:peptidyl-prolyl cis-trans isomerase SurA